MRFRRREGGKVVTGLRWFTSLSRGPNGAEGVIGPLFPGEYVASFLSLDKTGEEVETYQQEVTVTEETFKSGLVLSVK